MIRSRVLFLLGFLTLSVGWSVAQPPTGTDEPPVRLKKKKKPTADKPEPGVQNPDKPELKPDPVPPRKPRLEDDPDLDPRDDPKLPGGEQAGEEEILQRVARNTRLAEERLGKRQVGESTQQLQQEIVKDLDRLIQQQNSNQPNQQQNSDSSSSPSKNDPRQKRMARQRERQQNRTGDRTAQRPPRDSREQRSGQGTTSNPNSGNDSRAQGDPRDPEKKFDLWGHLPEKERALMNKEMEQKFMEKYEDLTKQFYRTIAEKSRKRD